MDLAQCRTITIILRVIQILLGFISLGVVVNLSSDYRGGEVNTILSDTRILSFVTSTSTYLTASFLLLIATIHRDSFESMRKAIFEMIYNIFGAIVQGINSIVLLAVIGNVAGSRGAGFYAAGVLSLINAALYFLTFFIAMKARQAT